MTADEARKISHDHSNTMQMVYKEIKEWAQKGVRICRPSMRLTDPQQQLLRDKGFKVEQKFSDEDGMPIIEIGW